MPENPKPPLLPEVLQFERVRGPATAHCYWTYEGFRKPKFGEWYVSGAFPIAYRAPEKTPMQAEYHIVKPTRFARHVTRFEPGEPVNLARTQP